MTNLPRILVVDDEEAILETMAFTFDGEYEVFTSTDARSALDILDEKAPIAAVLTDQRMPDMSGVEFVTEVWKRHPNTVRIILTGFADMEAIIKAINDGHIYAYLTKPWEQDELKQLMKRATGHYELKVENQRLLEVQTRANLFLEAVMDQFDTGAIAVDDQGIIQAINRPVRDYLSLEGEMRGRALEDVLNEHGLGDVGGAAIRAAGDGEFHYDEIELDLGGRPLRARVTTRNLVDPSIASGESIGLVILISEISHEPLQRRFNEAVSAIVQCEAELRPVLVEARGTLQDLLGTVTDSSVDSPGMEELSRSLSRTVTAVDNWLDVDDALATQDFPDAQLLQDRLRVAITRWPLPDEIPGRVRDLSRRVEQYYESGENSKQRVL